MKILELAIGGFRSLRTVTWNPGDLNVIIGPNGSGKSNLLSAVELISISARGELGRHVLESGGMEPLLWDGQANAIAFAIKAGPVEPEGSVERDSLTYRVEMRRLGQGSMYIIQSEVLANYYPVEQEGADKPILFLERRGPKVSIWANQEEPVALFRDVSHEEETFLSFMNGGPDLEPMIGFAQFVGSWRVYQDVNFGRHAPVRQAAVARLEKQVEADGQNLIPVLHTLYTGDRDFEKGIDAAMRAAFGADYDKLVFPPAADQRIQLRIRWKTLRREQSAADLSDGTLRFLFLLAVLASPSPPPLVAIDEPETGLHPSMFPIIAEHAVDAADRTQVILTTHSPQFLDAFGDARPTTTVAKWEDGETRLKTLEGKDLEHWLKEYSLGALFRSGELENMA